jgi:hypothetical protein
VLVGDGRNDVQEAYEPLLGLPTTFTIGREGKICRQHTGYTAKRTFEEEIQALLK